MTPTNGPTIATDDELKAASTVVPRKSPLHKLVRGDLESGRPVTAPRSLNSQ